MAEATQNIRKAAVLIRSLDADTAERLLGQLPAAEAQQARAAAAALGPIDDDEQADVAAEMRLAAPLARGGASAGVELSFSSAASDDERNLPAGARRTFPPEKPAEREPPRPATNRFAFLETAPVTALVPYLTREHSQTIAVVLANLSPERAAEVLAALPARQQADILERLTALGESDPNSLQAVEQELAAWLAAQSARRHADRGARAADQILAAADDATRSAILSNVQRHKRQLAQKIDVAAKRNSAARIATPVPPTRKAADTFRKTAEPARVGTQIDFLRLSRAALGESSDRPLAPPRAPRSQHAKQGPERAEPTFPFEGLIRFERDALAKLLYETDDNVLVLALAGATHELASHVLSALPPRTAKALRKQLRSLGPTRLSDVEAAQQSIARAAARKLIAASRTVHSM